MTDYLHVDQWELMWHKIPEGFTLAFNPKLRILTIRYLGSGYIEIEHLGEEIKFTLSKEGYSLEARHFTSVDGESRIGALLEILLKEAKNEA